MILLYFSPLALFSVWHLTRYFSPHARAPLLSPSVFWLNVPLPCSLFFSFPCVCFSPFFSLPSCGGDVTGTNQIDLKLPTHDPLNYLLFAPQPPEIYWSSRKHPFDRISPLFPHFQGRVYTSSSHWTLDRSTLHLVHVSVYLVKGWYHVLKNIYKTSIRWSLDHQSYLIRIVRSGPISFAGFSITYTSNNFIKLGLLRSFVTNQNSVLSWTIFSSTMIIVSAIDQLKLFFVFSMAPATLITIKSASKPEKHSISSKFDLFMWLINVIWMG